MERVETTQPEKGQVSTPQATEPKDDESEFQEQRFQRCLSKIQKSVSGYPVERRPKLLAAALEQAMKGKVATEKLIAMEAQTRKACDNLLDAKTKAVLAVLVELSSVSGVSNDVGSYGTDLLNSTYHGKALVDEARKQFLGDSDIALLAEVFDLAKSINEAEDERHVFETEKATEDKPEQEERKKRDRLTGQAKVDYLVSQLTEDCQFTSPPFQRKVLKLVAKGTLSPPDWKATHDDKIYKVGKINRTFEGCSKSLRQKVIAQYLRDVMPALEVEYEETIADQDATDELLALTEGKTPKQIRDMTALLKNSKLTS